MQVRRISTQHGLQSKEEFQHTANILVVIITVTFLYTVLAVLEPEFVMIRPCSFMNLKSKPAKFFLKKGFCIQFFCPRTLLRPFCNVLLQNNGNLKQNIAKMSQDKKTRYEIGQFIMQSSHYHFTRLNPKKRALSNFAFQHCKEFIGTQCKKNFSDPPRDS